MSKIWDFENDNLFGSGPVTTTTLPLLHVLLHGISHATLADGANVARPGQNCQKSSKMSTPGHANLAEYIEPALLGASLPLRNPFGKISFLRECLKSAQNASGASPMHSSSKFELKTCWSKIGFLKMANWEMAIFLKRPSHYYTAPPPCRFLQGGSGKRIRQT